MFEIGTSLREARARRKLSYDQVEAETKIRAKYIRCLEEEDFDALPSGMYVKGFLRTYADYLGLDGQLYVDEYNSRHGDLHPEDMLFRRRERPAARRRRESSNAVLIALAAIVAVAVLVIVAWRFGGSPHQSSLPPAPPVKPPSQQNPLVPQVQKVKKSRAHTAHRTAVLPKTVTLKLVAVNGSAQLRVYHRGNPGAPVFRNTLSPGPGAGPTRFPLGFYVAQADPSTNVELVVNGRTYSLSGTVAPWLVTKRGVYSKGSAVTLRALG